MKPSHDLHRLFYRVAMFTVCAGFIAAAAAATNLIPNTELSMHARLEQSMHGEHRSAANRARNAWRHPLATLEFFGIESGMQVMEIWPGAGWYSEILAPALRNNGEFLVASYDVSIPAQPEYRYDLHQTLTEKFAAQPTLYDQVHIVPYSPPMSNNLGAANALDAVLTFRNMHGWYSAGQAELVLAEFFRVLKSGGVLGIVQHRADADADPMESAQQGYLPEATVIALAENVGFVLEARSEVNANPNDHHNHPAGVWTLPPSYRLGDVDRAQYAAIGESDRMTLRLRKP